MVVHELVYFWLLGAIVLCVLCYCAVIDVRSHRIPNPAVLAILGLAVLHMTLEGIVTRSFHPLLQGFGGFLAGIVPFALIILLTRGGMGAGDMKLFGAVGAFLGLRMAVAFILLTIVLAGFVSAFWLLSSRKDRKAAIPMAPFMAVAYLAVMVFQPCIADFLRVYYGI